MSYHIRRFYKNTPSLDKIVRTGLTLQEAQTHCKSDKTKTPEWFDGYEKTAKTGMPYTYPNYTKEQKTIQEYDDWLDSESSLKIIENYSISQLLKSTDNEGYWLAYDDYKEWISENEESEENGEDRK